MFKKIKPRQPKKSTFHIEQFPHCDQRVLHAPGECRYCDDCPYAQALRQAWSICFTGYEPEDKELPCPADHARGDNHTKWGGNVARPITQLCAWGNVCDGERIEGSIFCADHVKVNE